MRINVDNLLNKIIYLFPVITLIQGIPGLGLIGKVAMGVIILMLLLKIIKPKTNGSTAIVVFLTIICYMFSIFHTTFPLVNLNDLFYFIVWILYFIFVKENYNKYCEEFLNNRKFVFYTIIVWSFLVFVSLFLNSSYATTWGDSTKYFRSFTNSEHRFAGTCIFVLVEVALLWITNNKKNTLSYAKYSILPLISIYLSGARTYLLILLLFLISIYYMNCKRKVNFYLTIVPMLMLFCLFVMITPMGNKIISTTQNGYFGLVGTITSGRSVFWKYDIDAFMELPFYKKLLGNGFNFVYDVNLKYHKAQIYAHNDYINLLMNFGIVGLGLYLYVFVSFLNTVYKKIKINKLLKMCFFLIYFINAMLNMVYTYTCSVLVLPLLLYLLDIYQKQYNVKRG